MIYTNCKFLLITACCFCMLLRSAEAQRDFTRDNIVFILVDDLGYADLNSTRMPELDSLLQTRGGKFLNFISHQESLPSQVAFLTGNDPSRYNAHQELPLPLREGVPYQTELISERLQTLGYSTCHVGNWDAGNTLIESAIENGFQDSLEDDRANNVPYQNDRYPDIYQTEAAVKFLVKAEEPFFLYAALPSPRQPYKAPRSYFSQNHSEFGITPFEESQYLEELDGIVQIRNVQIPDEVHLRLKKVLYYSMISVLDEQVAHLHLQLEQRGVEDHTLFMFVSANGGVTPIADNGIYRGTKRTVHDGAHRAANGIVWPGVVGPGKTIKSNTWIGDMFGSFTQIAGESKPGKGLDGGSMIPAIVSNKQTRRGPQTNSSSIFAHFSTTRRVAEPSLIRGEVAIWRLGLKYVRYTTFALDGKVLDVREKLFNLNSDPGEQTNVGGQAKNLARLKKLRKEYFAWGGDSRLSKLKTDDHVKQFPNWKPPADWTDIRNRFSSDIWP